MGAEKAMSRGSSAQEPRDGSPLRLHLTATLVTTTRRQAVTLRSISSTAAMLEAPDLPPVGRMVQLRRGCLDAIATVAWTDGDRCGIEFIEPLDESDVIEQLQSPSDPTFTTSRDYFWRMREGSHQMSASDWATARARARGGGLVSKS